MLRSVMTVMTTSPANLLRPPRKTVSEAAYYDLRRMIARAELPPGVPLVIRHLAAKLKVSRTPVVEAIRRLERDGLVTVVAKWGATVKEWSWDEIVEAYCIRRALEGEAAELFVTRATPEDKRRLVELNHRFNQSAAGDPVYVDEADLMLHLHIAQATRYPRLYELIENSNIERTAIFGVTAKQAQAGRSIDYGAMVGLHDALVQALLGQDSQAARFELVRHINEGLERIARWREGEKEGHGLAAQG